ncbi:MAG TPA: hypothetical protein DD789_13310 [Firmicutes bacterium]|jgi:hypothetical protein|nr:hypothetical protein [Bacillota bacterium]
MGINKSKKPIWIWTKILIVALGITFINYLFLGGKMKENNTVHFFSGVEIQCETEEQKEVIVQVLRDLLTLEEEELRKQEYPDSFRKGNKIEARQVIYHHFVPDEVGKRLDVDFYKEVAIKEVRTLVINLLQKLEED